MKHSHYGQWVWHFDVIHCCHGLGRNHKYLAAAHPWRHFFECVHMREKGSEREQACERVCVHVNEGGKSEDTASKHGWVGMRREKWAIVGVRRPRSHGYRVVIVVVIVIRSKVEDDRSEWPCRRHRRPRRGETVARGLR